MRIVSVMMPDERDEAAEEPTSGPTSGAGKVAIGDAAPIPEPSPEEVPELLGERSDYPIPFGDDEDGVAREGRVDTPSAGRPDRDGRAGMPPPGGSEVEQPPA